MKVCKGGGTVLSVERFLEKEATGRVNREGSDMPIRFARCNSSSRVGATANSAA
jgi:hypothetical protein